MSLFYLFRFQEKFISDKLLVNCYGLNGMAIPAIELYRQMPENLINEVTHICVINACSHSGYVNEARSIFKNIQIKTDRIYTTMVYQTLVFLNLKNFS